jgi:hypothetical protein
LTLWDFDFDAEYPSLGKDKRLVLEAAVFVIPYKLHFTRTRAQGFSGSTYGVRSLRPGVAHEVS